MAHRLDDTPSPLGNIVDRQPFLTTTVRFWLDVPYGRFTQKAAV